jgi:hypothetical protein
MNGYDQVEIKVLTVVIVRGSVFWNASACSSLKVNDVSKEYAFIFRVNVCVKQKYTSLFSKGSHYGA